MIPVSKKEPEAIKFPDQYKVIGADLSLKRPGFCELIVSKVNGETKIKVRKLISVDNKLDKKKCHGQLLKEIREAFLRIAYPQNYSTTFFVRETEVMHIKVPSERNVSKVVGLMDWQLWHLAEKEWYSIYPVTIKKLITGSGRAEKDEVAKCLEKYVGKQTYKCDDESDAVAVTVAWLIQQGEINGG